jgi:hypothetical protein
MTRSIRRLARVLAAWLLLTSGCRERVPASVSDPIASRDRASGKPATPQPPEAYVLVRWDALLFRRKANGVMIPIVRYTYPSEDWRNDGCHIEEPPGPGPATIPELQVRGFSFRLISENEEFVEVETLGSERFSHCHPGWPALGGMRVRLWARRSDLLPVVAEPVVLRYDDGTSVRLAEGKGLRQLGSDRYEVLADPFPYLLAGESGGQPLQVELHPELVSDRWHGRHGPDVDARDWVWIDCVQPSSPAGYEQDGGCAVRRWQIDDDGRPERWAVVDGGRVFAGRVLAVPEVTPTGLERFELGCVALEAEGSWELLAQPLTPLAVRPEASPLLRCGTPWRALDATGRSIPLFWEDGQAAGEIELGERGATVAPLYLPSPFGGPSLNVDPRCKRVLVRPDAVSLLDAPPQVNTLGLCFGRKPD